MREVKAVIKGQIHITNERDTNAKRQNNQEELSKKKIVIRIFKERKSKKFRVYKTARITIIYRYLRTVTKKEKMEEKEKLMIIQYSSIVKKGKEKDTLYLRMKWRHMQREELRWNH